MIDMRSPGLNRMTVNGVPSPGRVRISGAGIPLNWEVRPGYGMTGATVVFRGRGLSKFTCLFEFWDQDQLDMWDPFAKVFDVPQKPIGPKLALGVSHPVLDALGIRSAVMENMGQLEINASGLWSITVAMLEYRAPIKAIVKPRGAVPPADQGGVVAKTEADFALVDMQAQFAKAQAAANGPK